MEIAVTVDDCRNNYFLDKTEIDLTLGMCKLTLIVLNIEKLQSLPANGVVLQQWSGLAI